MTYCYKNGILNCHIKDASKTHHVVWEEEIALDDLELILKRGIRRLIGRYNWNENYYMFKPSFGKKLTDFAREDPFERTVPFDILDWLKSMNQPDGYDAIMIKEIMRKGHELGNIPGIQYSKTQSYIVIPIDKNWRIKFNSDISRTFFYRIPFVKGILKFLNYLDSEGLLLGGIANDDEKMRAIRSLQREICLFDGLIKVIKD